MKRIASLAVLAPLVLCACHSRARTVVVGDLPSSDVEVMLLGNSLGHFQGPRIQFQAPSHFRDAYGSDVELDDMANDSFWLRVHTPCGVEDWCLRFPGEPPSGSKAIVAEARGRRDTTRKQCDDEQLDEIWFDDRDGPAHVLTVGSNTTRTIAAGSFGKSEVLAPACDADGRVAVDGRTIGALPAFVAADLEQGRNRSPNSFVVDPTGTRCYQFNEYEYGPSGATLDLPTPSDFLKGRHLYALEGFLEDGPLKKAPDSVQTTASSRTSRCELLDASCAQSPAARIP